MLYIFIGVLLILMFIGVPVAFSLGLTTLVVFIVDRGLMNIPAPIIAQRLVYALDSFPVLAIPFFLLAGKLMNTGGITARIFGFVNAAVGHVKGGLGQVNVVASMIFAGMSGSATADAAGLGAIEIKAMSEAGYDLGFSVGITGASATIGPIIPPSIPMVVYAVLAEVSVGSMFLGGILPGVLMGVGLMILVHLLALRRNYPTNPRASAIQCWDSFKGGFLSLLTPLIIIGGIWTGTFTPTEAGAISVAYAFVLSCVVYRETDWPSLVHTLVETMRDSANVLFILASGSFYGWLLIRYRIPILLTEYLLSLSSNPRTIMIILNLFFVVVGCFMSTVVSITILTPLLVPLIRQVGIDPIHFGVVMCLNLTLGNITPPFGMVLYVLCKISKLSFPEVVKSIAPFWIPLGIVLLLTILFPQLILWIPRTVIN